MVSEKQCSRCKESKPLEAFGKHRRQPDGLHYYCRSCVRERGIQYRSTEKGQARLMAYNRSEAAKERKRRYRQSTKGRAICAQAVRAWEITETGRQRRREIVKSFKLRHPEKAHAHIAVRLAIQRGDLQKAHERTCCRCGLQAKEYHHYNGYEGEAVLQVVPLCKQCHLAYERIQKCA